MYVTITVAAVEAAAATAAVSTAAAAIVIVVAVTYITGIYMYIPIYSNGGRSTPAASSAEQHASSSGSSSIYISYVYLCVYKSSLPAALSASSADGKQHHQRQQ